MMPLCKAIAKQLLGARYEGAVRALAAAGVLYLAVRAAGWQVTVAPAVLCLSTVWYTAGVLLQQLQGRRLQDTVVSLLAMPCRQRLAPVYTLTVGGCTLLTRTLPVWALFAAVGRWQPGPAAPASGTKKRPGAPTVRNVRTAGALRLGRARGRGKQQRYKRIQRADKNKERRDTVSTLFILVRKMGLEPTRHGHTHLKRACLPIPALPQMPPGPRPALQRVF